MRLFRPGDAVAGLVLFGLMSFAMPASDTAVPTTTRPDWVDAVAFLIALLLILLRRRWPLPVFGVAAAFTVLSMAAPWLLAPAALTCLICAYTVATRTGRAVAWLCGLAAGVAVYLAAGFIRGTWAQPEAVAILASAGLATAIGDLVRTRRAYLAEALERARRAEHGHEEEARRRVIEERVRIARELHDVVAHNIAMINVQAGVAAHVLRSRPDQAEESLAHVRRAARTVLDELSIVLGVLRDPDGDADEPARGLAHLPALVEQVAGAGLRLEHRREGPARELPAAVDLAAYRIIQESLTNAHKYATDDRARLRLRFTDDRIEITVSNVAAPGPRGDGYGLAGMRERATALGGRLTAGATGDGRFVVEAVLPAATPALETV
jgi:signal transduction histidine kinase